ncbi:MAG: hypothetical protein A2494_00525 [Candidatus Lloydbacteria bacterium RIFOXYC12_FULL_46_25]|uniref:Uncharacterized protein n=1 Tax=Candidatus Lloydbacteria bacterium RIFOXYC12_FULL_46_25 TaxID=1798670 RepID=A0A1G2DRR4_9BACT|nr:MAG: hypothetical protein A2494_00525 [Candidatus Lloydbacteria bacterium RIFOXYC12_FULL_46_25]
MSAKESWVHTNDYVKDAIETMSGGDENALRVCVEVTENVLSVDPDCALRPAGPLAPLYCMDALGIRDSNIYLFYKEVCHEHVGYMMALLRGVLLGLVSEKTLRHAIAHHGEGINLEVIVEKVQEMLPSFHCENIIPST